MVKKFKVLPNDDIEPWMVLFHQIEILDTAAEIAEEQGDTETLMNISLQMSDISNDLINLYILVSGTELPEEGEEEESGPSTKSGAKSVPLGFVHSPKEKKCSCGEPDDNDDVVEEE